MPINVVFMGSPEFALPVLRALAARYPVAGVVTQPDRPAGRGQAVTAPPVKLLARELELPVIQPRRLREAEAMQQLRAWQPDLIVVAAFGQILRPDVLDMPRYGCLNVHGSLLPRWRGASPIQSAILFGDRETGITIMKMDPGMDTGDILTQRSTPILDTDTAGSLGDRLSVIGAELLMETLPGYLDGSIQSSPQDPGLATHAPLLKKEDGQLDFTQPAEALARRVRAMYPWPGAYTTWQGQVLKIIRAHALEPFEAKPEKTYIAQKQPAIGTPSGLLILDEVQPAGKKLMEGSVFLRGARGWGAA